MRQLMTTMNATNSQTVVDILFLKAWVAEIQTLRLVTVTNRSDEGPVCVSTNKSQLS